MSVERGQRTAIRFGGVRAEVSLVKTSTKGTELAKAAQHETKRVLVAPAPEHEQHPEVSRSRAMTDPFGAPVGPVVAGEAIPAGAPVSLDVQDRARVAFDPLGADPALEVGGTTHDPDLAAEVERGEHTMDTTDAAHDRQRLAELEQTEAERVADALAPLVKPEAAPTVDTPIVPAGAVPAYEEPAEYVPPATEVQQGVHLADGTWLDLTKRLAEVDERTKVEGLEVVATIATNAVPRERVRDSHYVATADPKTSKVLALLWHGLRVANAAAVVRWTKRTAQTLGIVVARGTHGRDAHLVLLELEWAENMRDPGPRTVGPIKAEVTEAEVASAVDLVEAFAGPASVLDGLRDGRLEKRAELLELARAGKLKAYTPPAAPAPASEGQDLAAAFAASARALR